MNEDESSFQEVDNNDVNGNNLLQKSADKAKNELSKNLKNKAGKQAALKGKMAAAMGPVIFWGVVIIVAIIIIIGIIMFFVTMPGMVMEKIKSLFTEMGNYIATFFGADTTEQMSDTQIFETLDYLEEMGYDVKGFGFLTDYYTKNDKDEIEEALSDVEKENYKVDEKIGVVRDSADKIILAKSDFIFTYITSDNYIYTLKNNNVTKSTHLPGVLGHLESIFNGFTVAAGKVIRFLTPAKLRNFLFDPLEKFLGVELDDREIWGKGLIALRDDSGNLAEFDTLFNWDTVKIDVKKKKLSIRRRSLFNNNNPIEYSLDGWTGRYGMPIEFLLSVHVATMMPDLAYDMSTAFPTNVNITLHDATGEVVAAYKTKDGQYITYEELNKHLTGGSGRDLFSKVLSWFDNLVQSDKEVQIASKLGIDHAEN